MSSMRPRTTILPIVLSLAAVGLVGCGPDEAATQDGRSAEEERERAKTETKEAMEAVGDYAYAQKADFIADMETKLNELEVEIERLETRVAASGDVKADAQTKLDEVRAKWAVTKTKLEAAEAASESNWDEFERDAKQAQEDLETSFDDTRQWMSDKLEPPS